MNFRILLIAPIAVGMLLTAGCGSGPYKAKDTTKYTLENTEHFVLMDRAVQHSVTYTGMQRNVLADGRLEVVVNVKNREERRIEVQLSCVFKDLNGVSTGDETPWRTVILGENTTEAVQFTSMNDRARDCTIRVRQAR